MTDSEPLKRVLKFQNCKTMAKPLKFEIFDFEIVKFNIITTFSLEN